MPKRNPLLICGYPRSGTTLLRSMLCQHARIRLVNEPELLLAFYRAGHSLSSTLSPDQQRRLRTELGRVPLCDRHLQRLPPAVLAALDRSPDWATVRDLYESLLPRPPGFDGVWGEKSLNNLFFVPDILTVYPDALIVHLVRDARSTALSSYQKKIACSQTERSRLETAWLEWAPFFASRAMRWARWMEFARGLDKRAVLQIRYEDLVAEPQKHLQRICAELGVDYEPRMLEAASRGNDPVLASAQAYAHGNIAREIDPSRARAYQSLPPALTWVVERFAGESLEALGYELVRPELTAWQRWQVRWQWLKHRRRLEQETAEHMRLRRPAQAG